MIIRHTICAAAALLLVTAAHAEIVVGVSLSTTGPSASLGITQKNSLTFYPDTIGGEKLRLVLVDDASDPSTGARMARKLVTEDHVDLIVGSSAVAPSIAIAEVATESQTPQLSLAPVELKPGKGDWTYRLAQPISLMAEAIAARMASSGVKTVGFIGFADAYGESWWREFSKLADVRKLKVVANERFARTDASVTGQALKLMAAKPDAILIAGAGTPAALPERTLVERGYKGRIYQTHGIASTEFLKVGGKDVEGTLFPTGPVVVARELPANHPVRKVAVEFADRYEAKYGPNSVTQFAGDAWGAWQLLDNATARALKTGAKPGTPAFRAALRDALETTQNLTVPNGVLNLNAQDHQGFDQRSRVMGIITNGRFAYAGPR